MPDEKITFDSDVSADIITEKLSRHQWTDSSYVMSDEPRELDVCQIAPRQQGKTILLGHGRVSYPAITKPEREPDSPRYHVVANTYANRQQRRAAERAERKRLRS